MAIKHALLSLLADEPRGVTRLRRDFEEATDSVWPVNVGQVYQTIQRLARDGLIELSGSEADPDSGRRVDLYAITEAGTEELRAWVDTPCMKATTDRDDLVMKVALAASNAWDTDTVIQTQRESIMAALQTLTRQASATAPTLNAERLNLERHIFELEGEVRWLDRIDSLASQHEHRKDS